MIGEQSVGKSYALNHFVDSSFAGSAMRCTEGVWLSITPTSDVLIVALDFEGIMRLACQKYGSWHFRRDRVYWTNRTWRYIEIVTKWLLVVNQFVDTFLVLFNAAISNLVRITSKNQRIPCSWRACRCSSETISRSLGTFRTRLRYGFGLHARKNNVENLPELPIIDTISESQ